MFRVDEYNLRKKITIGLFITEFSIFTLFYFLFKEIPAKWVIFIGIISIGAGVWLYFNLKGQIEMKRKLY